MGEVRARNSLIHGVSFSYGERLLELGWGGHTCSGALWQVIAVGLEQLDYVIEREELCSCVECKRMSFAASQDRVGKASSGEEEEEEGRRRDAIKEKERKKKKKRDSERGRRKSGKRKQGEEEEEEVGSQANEDEWSSTDRLHRRLPRQEGEGEKEEEKSSHGKGRLEVGELARLWGTLTMLQMDVGSLSRRLKGLETEVGEARGREDAASKQIGRLEGAVARIEEATAAMGAKMASSPPPMLPMSPQLPPAMTTLKKASTLTTTKVRRSHTIAGPREAARLRVSFQMDATFADKKTQEERGGEMDKQQSLNGEGKREVDSPANLPSCVSPGDEGDQKERRKKEEIEEEEGGGGGPDVSSSPSSSSLPRSLSLGSLLVPLPSAVLEEEEEEDGKSSAGNMRGREEGGEEGVDGIGVPASHPTSDDEQLNNNSSSYPPPPPPAQVSSRPASTSSIGGGCAAAAAADEPAMMTMMMMSRSWSLGDVTQASDYEFCMLPPSPSPSPSREKEAPSDTAGRKIVVNGAEATSAIVERRRKTSSSKHGDKVSSSRRMRPFSSTSSSPSASTKRLTAPATAAAGLFFDFRRSHSSGLLHRSPFGSFRLKSSSPSVVRTREQREALPPPPLLPPPSTSSLGSGNGSGKKTSPPLRSKSLRSTTSEARRSASLALQHQHQTSGSRLKKQQRLSWSEDFENAPEGLLGKGESSSSSNLTKASSVMDFTEEGSRSHPWVISDPMTLREMKEMISRDPGFVLKSGQLELRRGAGAFKGYRGVWCALTTRGEFYAFSGDGSDDVGGGSSGGGGGSNGPKVAWRIGAGGGKKGRWAVKMVTEGGKDVKKHSDKKAKRSRYFMLLPPAYQDSESGSQQEDQSSSNLNHLNSLLLHHHHHHHHQSPRDPRQFQAPSKDEAEAWMDMLCAFFDASNEQEEELDLEVEEEECETPMLVRRRRTASFREDILDLIR